MNQTVRQKTKQELECAFYFGVWPLIWLSGSIEPLRQGKYLKFAIAALMGFETAAAYAYYRKNRHRRSSRAAVEAALQQVDVKMSVPKIIGLWALTVCCAVMFGWVYGLQVYVMVAAPLTPVWQRFYLVLAANFLGLSAFWFWRALYNFTAELLREPPPLNAVASVAPPAVVPAAVAQAVPATSLVVLQNGVTRP